MKSFFSSKSFLGFFNNVDDKLLHYRFLHRPASAPARGGAWRVSADTVLEAAEVRRRRRNRVAEVPFEKEPSSFIVKFLVKRNSVPK